MGFLHICEMHMCNWSVGLSESVFKFSMSLGHGVSLHSETIFKSIKTTLNLRHTSCFYVFTGGRTLKLHLYNASNLNNLTFTETLKPHCPVLSEEN